MRERLVSLLPGLARKLSLTLLQVGGLIGFTCGVGMVLGPGLAVIVGSAIACVVGWALDGEQ